MLRQRLCRALAPFDRRALAHDVASASTLGLVGDVACQYFVEGRRMPGRSTDADRALDPRRMMALMLFNGAYVGTFLHFLYKTYPVVVFAAASRLRPSPLKSHLLCENATMHAHACAWVDNVHCGVLYIPVYYFSVGLLQGVSAADSANNLLKEWLSTYTSCSAFWVPYMSANFAFVPANRRVQAMALGNLVWSVVIDYFAHRSL
ncbi:hypothetical protein AB1Y20_006579 [Prymnesium parvum]|uniref:Uncharacterized protein n=1 Tax=Prymnesium parvum TaxID=97485 RepID=A0AB34J071_PRYPA